MVRGWNNNLQGVKKSCKLSTGTTPFKTKSAPEVKNVGKTKPGQSTKVNFSFKTMVWKCFVLPQTKQISKIKTHTL